MIVDLIFKCRIVAPNMEAAIRIGNNVAKNIEPEINTVVTLQQIIVNPDDGVQIVDHTKDFEVKHHLDGSTEVVWKGKKT